MIRASEMVGYLGTHAKLSTLPGLTVVVEVQDVWDAQGVLTADVKPLCGYGHAVVPISSLQFDESSIMESHNA